MIKLYKFINLLENNLSVTKVGFSLYLDDLPDSNPNKHIIINWEKQFWGDDVNEFFIASIDTTFSLYRPNYKIENKNNFLKAIRVNKPYSAIHGGWYINPNKLTDEQKYYIKTANDSSSWLTDDKGSLINNLFKTHYKSNKLND